MAWVKEQKWLLAGTESGLIGWNLPTKVLTGSKTSKASMVDFELGDSGQRVQFGPRSRGGEVCQLWEDSRVQGGLPHS